MSNPLAPSEILSQFRKWNVSIRSEPGWDHHRRDPAHGPWGPVHGIMIHHTADDAPDDLDFRVLWNGRSDLPGPLCNWGMADNGTAWLCSGGRANHAGMGSGAVLAEVIQESGHYVPVHDDTDGNTAFYGQETMYSGGHPMTADAYNATVRACAAICEAHHWTGKSVIGHREWTTRKIDPGHCDLDKLRGDVNHCLVLGPVRAKGYNFQ